MGNYGDGTTCQICDEQHDTRSEAETCGIRWVSRRVQTLEGSDTVTECQHDTAELLAFVEAVRDGRDEDADEYGLRFLGSGVEKSAYALPCGKHVIKIGSSRGQTPAELLSWNSAPDALRAILAPIHAASADGSVLIAVRAQMTRDSSDFDDVVHTAESYGITDLHPGNLGYINGEPVVIDYGFGEVQSQPNSDNRRGECDCEQCVPQSESYSESSEEQSESESSLSRSDGMYRVYSAGRGWHTASKRCPCGERH